MVRRGIVAFRLLLIAGLLTVPGSGGNPDRVGATDSEPPSGPKISISALGPAITPATPEPVATWLAGRRDQQKTYSRLWALVAAGLPHAAVLALGLLRSACRRGARSSVAGSAISSRAPPASAFA